LRKEPSVRAGRLEQARQARRFRGRHGWVVVGVGWVVFVAAAILLLLAVSSVTRTTDVLVATVLTSVALCGGALVAGGLVELGRRLKAKPAESILERDKRSPVVYLRPFETDKHRASRLVSMTYEQVLARAFRKVGPFVTVGDPTERLPKLGAARTYVDDADWRGAVADLTARAGVIVLQAGESEGLAWEIEHVVRLDRAERVLIALAVRGSRRQPTKQASYEAFRRTAGALFPRPLPDTIGKTRFLFFEADWTPRLYGFRGSPPVEVVPGSPGERRARALRAVSRQLACLVWVSVATGVAGVAITAVGIGGLLLGLASTGLFLQSG
jgi:hypothetical protein